MIQIFHEDYKKLKLLQLRQADQKKREHNRIIPVCH